MIRENNFKKPYFFGYDAKNVSISWSCFVDIFHAEKIARLDLKLRT